MDKQVSKEYVIKVLVIELASLKARRDHFNRLSDSTVGTESVCYLNMANTYTEKIKSIEFSLELIKKVGA